MLSAFPSLRPIVRFTLLALLFLSSGSLLAPAQTPSRILAPELEGGVGWLGTDKPLLLKSLRGKIVVFDFWTLC